MSKTTEANSRMQRPLSQVDPHISTLLREEAERQATGDPRPSIEERYASKADYLRQVQQVAEALVQQGYLLAEDLPTVAEQAAQRSDMFRGQQGYRAGANDGASDVSDAT